MTDGNLGLFSYAMLVATLNAEPERLLTACSRHMNDLDKGAYCWPE